jgi:hypothetical protein
VVALRKRLAILAAGALAWLGSMAGARAAAAGDPPPAPPARIEVRSADLLAIGLVQGDRMTIHVSRLIDNVPVRDAVVAVLLRGTMHPTTAEPDGGYSFETPDLRVPGEASVQVEVVRQGVREELKGTLKIAESADKPEDKNSSRQLGWWVLNFVVCIGFLVLWRRRKAASS